MQTVNFQCGHCSNLMAVSTEYLGQQVRCPHCQQVVLAPASAAPQPAPAPEPERPFQSLEQHEDIFHQPSETEDALFGQEEAPRLEMPAPVPLSPLDLPSAGSPSPNGSHPANEALTTTPAEEPAHPWTPASPAAADDSTGQASLPSDAIPASVRRSRGTGKGVDWFVPLVFIPVVVYAVLATAAAGFMYIRMKTAPKSLFEQMPDEGDTPGVTRKTRVFLNFDRKAATQPLPPNLIVPLGQSLTVGDLEITPRRVERRQVSIFTEGAEEKPEPSPYEALVLHLHLRNVSREYAFTPLDNYFDRRWKPAEGGAPPLTMLMAGKEVFFGGPARWYPTQRDRNKGLRRDWLVGRQNVDRQGLAPGAEATSYVCTDGWDPQIQEVLFGINSEGQAAGKPFQGDLLWRVRVRRGLVSREGRELPATSVIGVTFRSTDYATKGI